jgi:hypothetical protein
MAQFALIIAPTGQYLYRLGRVPVALPGVADETSPAALLARHTHPGDSLEPVHRSARRKLCPQRAAAHLVGAHA